MNTFRDVIEQSFYQIWFNSFPEQQQQKKIAQILSLSLPSFDRLFHQAVKRARRAQWEIKFDNLETIEQLTSLVASSSDKRLLDLDVDFSENLLAANLEIILDFSIIGANNSVTQFHRAFYYYQQDSLRAPAFSYRLGVTNFNLKRSEALREFWTIPFVCCFIKAQGSDLAKALEQLLDQDLQEQLAQQAKQQANQQAYAQKARVRKLGIRDQKIIREILLYYYLEQTTSLVAKNRYGKKNAGMIRFPTSLLEWVDVDFPPDSPASYLNAITNESLDPSSCKLFLAGKTLFGDRFCDLLRTGSDPLLRRLFLLNTDNPVELALGVVDPCKDNRLLASVKLAKHK